MRKAVLLCIILLVVSPIFANEYVSWSTGGVAVCNPAHNSFDVGAEVRMSALWVDLVNSCAVGFCEDTDKNGYLELWDHLAIGLYGNMGPVRAGCALGPRFRVCRDGKNDEWFYYEDGVRKTGDDIIRYVSHSPVCWRFDLDWRLGKVDLGLRAAVDSSFQFCQWWDMAALLKTEKESLKVGVALLWHL